MSISSDIAQALHQSRPARGKRFTPGATEGLTWYLLWRGMTVKGLTKVHKEVKAPGQQEEHEHGFAQSVRIGERCGPGGIRALAQRPREAEGPLGQQAHEGRGRGAQRALEAAVKGIDGAAQVVRYNLCKDCAVVGAAPAMQEVPRALIAKCSRPLQVLQA